MWAIHPLGVLISLVQVVLPLSFLLPRHPNLPPTLLLCCLGRVCTNSAVQTPPLYSPGMYVHVNKWYYLSIGMQMVKWYVQNVCLMAESLGAVIQNVLCVYFMINIPNVHSYSCLMPQPVLNPKSVSVYTDDDSVLFFPEFCPCQVCIIRSKYVEARVQCVCPY